jgi:peptidoglycan/xylan/chitin deacetylase (PgdA/CDA1 family)
VTAGVVARLWARARRLVRPTSSGGTLVLLYHRVATPAVDPWRLGVSPAHFAEHLAVLRRLARPIALRELAAALRAGRPLPPDGVVVTLDDGYADNLHAARPLLDRHDVPATVFVTSGALGTPGFWWDRLARVLLGPGLLPPTLALSVAGRRHEAILGDDAAWDAGAAVRHPGWEPWGDAHPTARHRAYRTFYDALFPLDAAAREQALATLPRTGGDAEDRPLSRDEVRTLAADGLVEIGCHTRTHPVLATLSREAQRDEIRTGRSDLEAIVGAPVTSFAYPFGRRSDYDADSTALVREAGFACACSNFDGPVGAGTDPFQLPRFQVRDWDGDGLAAALRAWRAGDAAEA